MDSRASLTATREVAPEDSAERWGNAGIDVLSTPAILGEVERLCDAVMKPHLDEGRMTVGVEVTMRHNAPVRVGGTVTYTVTAAGDVGRKTDFSFEVLDGRGELVCAGTHRRAVVDAAGFRERLAAAGSR